MPVATSRNWPPSKTLSRNSSGTTLVPKRYCYSVSLIENTAGVCTISGRSKSTLPKFEECIQRLEKIVQELEQGEVPLEKSLTLFEEGMQLSGSCRKELEEAEGKVEILLKQNGKIQAEPFERSS